MDGNFIYQTYFQRHLEKELRKLEESGTETTLIDHLILVLSQLVRTQQIKISREQMLRTKIILCTKTTCQLM